MNSANIPKVSVIMGIYNCESTLETSIDSLLEQSFQDFNVIICDDGSVDNTIKIARRFCDRYPEKFILLKNQKNMGLNYTLNVCLSAAKGEYIARMDGDDISLPSRFQKEVDFLDNHSDIAIVSSVMIYFDETGDWGVGRHKQTPQKEDLVSGTPFAHAPCMVRREAYEAVNGYTVDNRLLRVEDYHLWIKMYSKGYRGYNIQEPLYKMRDDQNAVNRRNLKGRLNEIYVKYLAIKMLKLPFWYLLLTVRPVIVGLLPNNLYTFLRKKKSLINKKIIRR
jgi:glycosyltransferase EpsE